MGSIECMYIVDDVDCKPQMMMMVVVKILSALLALLSPVISMTKTTARPGNLALTSSISNDHSSRAAQDGIYPA